jgi:GT2 family glycosyltransferase
MVTTEATVIIPTYKRPDQLTDCVQSVLNGQVLPREIVLVHRRGDDSTTQVIDTLSEKISKVTITKASVEEPGHIPPVEEGLRHCDTEIVCLLDDDTVVEDDWLEELLRPFADPSVGVVGGPAVVPDMQDESSDPDAGQLRAYGQLGGGLMWCTEGRVREVDTVPEGNSAWRADLLRSMEIPPFLYEGDSNSYGLYLTLNAKDRGYRVLFNPEAFIWHYPGRRDPSIDRTNQHRQHWLSSRNYALIALHKMAPRRAFLYFIHAFVVGTYGDIGFLRALYMLVNGDDKWRCVFSCGKGRIDALRQYFAESRDPQPVRN